MAPAVGLKIISNQPLWNDALGFGSFNLIDMSSLHINQTGH